MGGLMSVAQARWGTLSSPQRALLAMCAVYTLHRLRYAERSGTAAALSARPPAARALLTTTWSVQPEGRNARATFDVRSQGPVGLAFSLGENSAVVPGHHAQRPCRPRQPARTRSLGRAHARPHDAVQSTNW